MAIWCSLPGYLANCVDMAHRVSLDGTPATELTAQDRANEAKRSDAIQAAIKRSKQAPGGAITMKSASDYPHKIEFVCSQCLASVYSNDDDPVPHCARCLIRMLPDSDEPATYHSALRPQMSRRRVNAAA
jgi:hypothetical protein